MKVGDYVRTKEFGINRVEWFDKGEPILENGFTALQEDYKSSSNIIDLIEENDLIKYRICGDLYISEVQGHPESDKYKLHIEYSDTIINLEDLEVVSVLTHEQFSQMEYKL